MVHKSLEFRTWLRENFSWLIFLFVPANCTSKLQPCDVIVQRPFKYGFKPQFDSHSTNAVRENLQSGKKPYIPVKISELKGHLSIWLLHAWKCCADRLDMLQRGWAKCGLLDVWDIKY